MKKNRPTWIPRYDAGGFTFFLCLLASGVLLLSPIGHPPAPSVVVRLIDISGSSTQSQRVARSIAHFVLGNREQGVELLSSICVT